MTHAGEVFEELQPVGRAQHYRSLWRTGSCGRDPTLEQGKSVRRKEQQRQRVMN